MSNLSQGLPHGNAIWRQSIQSVFQQLLGIKCVEFQSDVESSRSPDCDLKDNYRMKIELSGPEKLTLHLAASDDLANHLTRCMLGDEHPVDSDLKSDVMNEIGNQVAGLVKRDLPDGDWSLQLPRTVVDSLSAEPELPTMFFSCEEGTIQLSVGQS